MAARAQYNVVVHLDGACETPASEADHLCQLRWGNKKFSSERAGTVCHHLFRVVLDNAIPACNGASVVNGDLETDHFSNGVVPLVRERGQPIKRRYEASGVARANRLPCRLDELVLSPEQGVECPPGERGEVLGVVSNRQARRASAKIGRVLLKECCEPSAAVGQSSCISRVWLWNPPRAILSVARAMRPPAPDVPLAQTVSLWSLTADCPSIDLAHAFRLVHAGERAQERPSAALRQAPRNVILGLC